MSVAARFDARSTDGGEVGSAIERHGYAIVENMIDADELASLSGELDHELAGQATGESNFLGARTQRLNNLFMRAPTTRGMALHPVLLGAADHILLPWCARYQITYTGTMHLLPGETAQALHRDAFFYPFRNPGPITQQGSLWAVTEFTRENGATRIVPGSHQWDEERRPRADEIEVAEMAAGSAIIYAHSLIHGGGANATAQPRTAVAINLALGWLRQQENQFLTLPPDKARELPDQLQRLVGYDFGAPFMGAVNGRNPHHLLEEPGGPPGPRNDPELDRAYRERVHWLKCEVVPPPPGVLPTD
ncbi:MAG: phytanoyl-CoA dioxygenase family protein [bacterium]|nr:phytanoyl-CoA dioxygenase family protein [bacterium]MDE0415396.1 phytanoyl-CoA dioxygenase family protein [bacterium]